MTDQPRDATNGFLITHNNVSTVYVWACSFCRVTRGANIFKRWPPHHPSIHSQQALPFVPLP